MNPVEESYSRVAGALHAWARGEQPPQHALAFWARLHEDLQILARRLENADKADRELARLSKPAEAKGPA